MTMSPFSTNCRATTATKKKSRKEKGAAGSPRRSFIIPSFKLYSCPGPVADTLYIISVPFSFNFPCFISPAPSVHTHMHVHTPPCVPSLLSVTGWKQRRDKETPVPIQGALVETPRQAARPSTRPSAHGGQTRGPERQRGRVKQ